MLSNVVGTEMVLFQSDLKGIKLLHRGKVRDTYELDDRSLLIVATDRISAFDVVMKTAIPEKGRVLTQMTLFWLKMFAGVCPNHLLEATMLPTEVAGHAEELEGRFMVVKRLRMLPIEAIVRGYLSGSGWKEYRERGTVCGIKLPKGLQESSRLPRPLFTPSTKAEVGHDQNIHPDEAARLVGQELVRQIEELSLTLYARAADYALTRGIVIADTKFEFGLDENGMVVLADEVLTPDSSRFWPADDYEPGRPQVSYDKQFVRDWLESINFDKNGPGIEIPPDVVARTSEKYLEVYRRLTAERG